jgi:signal peptidase
MKILKKIMTVIVSIALWIIILVAALYAFTTLATRDGVNVSNIAGYTPMIVETDSMSPTFNSGDLILIKSCDVSKLKEGDVITFHTIIDNEYALNTHRIEEITEENGVRSYVTKGDNNEISDTHIISDGDIVGKYIGRLPNAGKLMNILSSSTGFLVIIVLPMLLFFIYQVYHLIMVSINLKKAIAREEALKQQSNTEKSSSGDTDEILAQAEAALAEAKRLKAEAEAKLAQAESTKRSEEE